MASISHLQNDDQDQDETLTILVTGFGPFVQRFPVNPSFEIAKHLPKVIPGGDGRRTIRVITYGSPVKVAYDEVRELIPRLHDEYSDKVDVVLHIGMAAEGIYSLERYAHRDGYSNNYDLDGKVPPSDEGRALFGDCPHVMEPSLRYHDILSRWQKKVHDIPEGSAGHGADAKPSDNAGYYMCDYIYFQSLAYFARKSGVYEGGKDQDRPVLFLHVPAESDDRTLAQGQAVAVSLLTAVADSYTKPAQNGVH